MCIKTKLCGSCKKELPETKEYFAERKLKTKTVFQWQCRNCHKAYRKKHYEHNKEKYVSKANDYRKEVSDWFQELKEKLNCSKCDEKRWWVLDFHHADPSGKEYNLG